MLHGADSRYGHLSGAAAALTNRQREAPVSHESRHESVVGNTHLLDHHEVPVPRHEVLVSVGRPRQDLGPIRQDGQQDAVAAQRELHLCSSRWKTLGKEERARTTVADVDKPTVSLLQRVRLRYFHLYVSHVIRPEVLRRNGAKSEANEEANRTDHKGYR